MLLFKKEYRKQAGLTHSQLANLAEVEKTIISQIKKNKRTFISNNLLSVLKVLYIEIQFKIKEICEKQKLIKYKKPYKSIIYRVFCGVAEYCVFYTGITC